MAFDNYKNFVLVTVPQGYEASDTSVTISPEDIARLPAPPFNLTWWDSTNYTTPSLDPNREIVRVTAAPSGTLVSFARAQEGTTATDKNTPDATYSMLAAATEKFFADLEAELALLVGGDAALDARLDTAEAAIITLDTRVDSHDTTLTTLASTDTAYDARLDALEAAGGGISGNPNVFAVADYGASGSAVTTTGSITTGTATLTVASAASFEVGHGVFVAGAGASGAALVTTISSIAGNVLTLAANASATVNNVLVQHDDTVAIQAAIDAAHAANGGTVQFFDGVFKINRAFDATTNSILKVPFVADGAPPIPLRLKGSTPPPLYNYDGAVATAGTVILTSTAGTGAWPSMLAGAAFDATISFRNDNYINLYIEDMTWRTYDNPTISALDLGMFYNAVCVNLQVDTGTSLQATSEPVATTVGIRLPQVGNFGLAYIENSTIIGYRRGVTVSEHFIANNVTMLRCYTGLYCVFGHHPSFGNFHTFECPEGIVFADYLPVEFSVDFEIGAVVGWANGISGHTIYDPGNVGYGWIKYKGVQTWTGTPLVASTTGCANLTITDLHGGNTIASGDLSLGNLTVRTGMLISDGMMIKPVTIGADDSGGVGFRALVITNASPGFLIDLKAYWALDEASGGRADSHGLVHLTDVNTVGSTAGKIGNAGQFVAANMEYLTGADVNLNQGDYSYTFQAWVRLATKTASRFIVSKASAGGIEYGLYYDLTADRFQFFSNCSSTFKVVIADTLGSPAVDTWYYLLAGHNADTGHVFIQVNNGAVDVTTTGGAIPSAVGVPFHIGIYHPTAEQRPMDGLIDEVGLWRRLLTPAEKTALYNGGAGLAYPFS